MLSLSFPRLEMLSNQQSEPILLFLVLNTLLGARCCHHQEQVLWFSNWDPRNLPGGCGWKRGQQQTGWGLWISSLLQSLSSSRVPDKATFWWALTVFQIPPETPGALGVGTGRGRMGQVQSSSNRRVSLTSS